jgi:uncharacterized protein (DUF1330 family)
MAKGYWIAVYRSITKPEALPKYAALAGPAIEKHGGKFLVRGMPAKVYEAGLQQRTVIIEFPSLDAAVAAHDSPEYQAALKEIHGAAERDMRFVEGV